MLQDVETRCDKTDVRPFFSLILVAPRWINRYTDQISDRNRSGRAFQFANLPLEILRIQRFRQLAQLPDVIRPQTRNQTVEQRNQRDHWNQVCPEQAGPAERTNEWSRQ